MVAAVDNFDELQHRAKSVPNGRKGLEFGCSPHVLDAAKLIKESWDAVTSSTIAACWARASCLHKCDEQLRGIRDYRKQISRETINEMIDLLNNLKIKDRLEKAVMATGLDYAVDASDKEDVLGLWVTFENSENFVQSETNYLLAEIDQSPHIEREDSPLPGPSTSQTYPAISQASANEEHPDDSDISLQQATEMAKKLLDYATERSDPVLLDYISVVHSMLKGDLDSQSK